MIETRDWSRNREMWVRVLEKQTGEDVRTWLRRINKARLRDEKALSNWLRERGVTGYAEQLLVMERFGYPDFVLASADELIDRQYADRRHLRGIYNAILDASQTLGQVAVQARKTYVSLVTPRRTFARVVPSTRERVDLGLRIEGMPPRGRLQQSRIHETMALQVSLTSAADVDSQVRGWLRRAYEQNIK
jgi:hypothetical protein